MRPVSRVSRNNKSSQRPVSAQVARRRDLRRQRRQTLLLQLWRFVALLLLSGGFSWILLRHGWTLRSPEAVILTGGAALETNQVIEAAKLRFPSPLLEVSPRELEQHLVGALPVHSAHVQRRMFPARLDHLIGLKVSTTGQDHCLRAPQRPAMAEQDPAESATEQQQGHKAPELNQRGLAALPA